MADYGIQKQHTMMATAVFKYSSKFRNVDTLRVYLIGDRIEGSGCTPTKGLRISTVRSGVGAYPAKSSKITPGRPESSRDRESLWPTSAYVGGAPT